MVRVLNLACISLAVLLVALATNSLLVSAQSSSSSSSSSSGSSPTPAAGGSSSSSSSAGSSPTPPAAGSSSSSGSSASSPAASPASGSTSSSTSGSGGTPPAPPPPSSSGSTSAGSTSQSSNSGSSNNADSSSGNPSPPAGSGSNNGASGSSGASPATAASSGSSNNTGGSTSGSSSGNAAVETTTTTTITTTTTTATPTPTPEPTETKSYTLTCSGPWKNAAFWEGEEFTVSVLFSPVLNQTRNLSVAYVQGASYSNDAILTPSAFPVDTSTGDLFGKCLANADRTAYSTRFNISVLGFPSTPCDDVVISCLGPTSTTSTTLNESGNDISTSTSGTTTEAAVTAPITFTTAPFEIVIQLNESVSVVEFKTNLAALLNISKAAIDMTPTEGGFVLTFNGGAAGRAVDQGELQSRVLTLSPSELQMLGAAGLMTELPLTTNASGGNATETPAPGGPSVLGVELNAPIVGAVGGLLLLTTCCVIFLVYKRHKDKKEQEARDREQGPLSQAEMEMGYAGNANKAAPGSKVAGTMQKPKFDRHRLDPDI